MGQRKGVNDILYLQGRKIGGKCLIKIIRSYNKIYQNEKCHRQKVKKLCQSYFLSSSNAYTSKRILSIQQSYEIQSTE